MRQLILTILLLFSLAAYATEYSSLYRVVFYNVENLFYPTADSINTDTDYTPDGVYHWNYFRYYKKLHALTKVLTNIGQHQGVDIAGLCEVEDAQCLHDLCRLLNDTNYTYIHYDSPDKRGIDVALVYKKNTFRVLYSAPIKADTLFTRSLLYVKGSTSCNDTLHLIVCHLPSQLGGKEAEHRRLQIKRLIQQQVDSIVCTNKQADIIVMGDMNMSPQRDMHHLHNRMMDYEKQGIGTHKWQGIWTCLDQFYTSNQLTKKSTTLIYDAAWLMDEDKKYLGYKPKRTYIGYTWQDGYSDHLPVVLLLTQL